MAIANEEKRTRWHHLLGKLLEETLIPLGVMVYTDFPIMSEPPKTDVLLLRNEKNEWTREQKARLPDGIRDCRASHVLLEFKYTESVNRKAVLQTICYDYLYKQTRNLSDKEVRTFLISSKTPVKKTLGKFGFEASVFPGVFCSASVLLKNISLISLNDLSGRPHNAFFKVFASRTHEKRISFDSLMKNAAVSSSPEIMWLVEGLATYWLYYKGEGMENELTPEKVRELGRRFHDVLISTIPLDKFLAKYGKDAILTNFKPEDRVAGLKPKDRVAGLKPKDRLAGLKPKDRLAGLKPKDRLAGLTVEELEELEICLRELKNKVFEGERE